MTKRKMRLLVVLRRGRIFWQKSREELLAEVRAQLGSSPD
jgi:hypothetical protein